MEKKGSLIISKKPKLRKPYLVCGISGWVDGGEASTGTVKYLIKRLKAKKFAEMETQRFHVFQLPGQTMLRPQVKIEDGLLKQHIFPKNEFFYWINSQAQHDLVLFLGSEPSTNWEEYATTLLDLAQDLGVDRIYLLNGVFDRSPHTREPVVSCLVSNVGLKQEMNWYAVQFVDYEGPGSFGSTLLYLSQKRRGQFISMIARSTCYPELNIIIHHNPKAIYAIMKRLNRLLDINLDLSDLDKASRELEAKFDLMSSQNPQLRAYVAELEQNFVEVRYEEPLEITGNEAVRIAEEFLRKDKEEHHDA